MAEGRYDRPSSLREVLATRKRQERAARQLLFRWIGVMLLVVGAGFLVYRFLRSRTPLQTGSRPQTSSVADIVATPSATGTTGPTDPGGRMAPSAVPTAVTRVITYTVQQGDTLTGIAGRYGVNLYDLTILNPSLTPDLVKEGDELSILVQEAGPATATPSSPVFQAFIDYQVVAGDTLGSIAGRFGSTVEAIAGANGLGSPDQIREGQRLKIPVPAATVRPTGTAPEATVTATP